MNLMLAEVEFCLCMQVLMLVSCCVFVVARCGVLHVCVLLVIKETLGMSDISCMVVYKLLSSSWGGVLGYGGCVLKDSVVFVFCFCCVCVRAVVALEAAVFGCCACLCVVVVALEATVFGCCCACVCVVVVALGAAVFGCCCCACLCVVVVALGASVGLLSGLWLWDMVCF